MKVTLEIPDSEYSDLVTAFAIRDHYKPTILEPDEEGVLVEKPNPIMPDDSLVVSLLNTCETVLNDYRRGQALNGAAQSRLAFVKK